MKTLVLLLIRVYRGAISPWIGPCCRFEPTCSAYAMEAVETHGVVKGLWLTTRRLLRCRPGGGGGYDPVPGAATRPDARTDRSRS